MKKYLILIISLIAGVAISDAQYKEGYYDAMNGKKKEQLKAAVKTCVQNHTRLEYYDLPNNWRYTDTYPDLYDGNLRWWEMYSNNIYLIYSNQSPKSSFSANKMQREHSVPKSWWKYNNDVEYTPAYTDLMNLLPSDGECNQAKSNYPFGVVADGRATYNNGSAKVGVPAAGQGGGAAFVFEPADEYKGDFARGIFYMACVYDDLPWVTSYVYNMFQQNSYPTLKSWAYSTLLEWHRNDPVSQKEINRNNAVEGQQGNRNPFIDFPNLAEYIWGSSTDVAFFIADQGDAQTPVPDKSYITEPVNGEALDFGECAVGGSQVSYLEVKGMITSSLSISISGTDKSMFTPGAKTITTSQLNQTKTYLFPITFTPTSTGDKTANLLIYDGGLDTEIVVTLRGKGAEMPTLTQLTAYEPTDVTEESYVAHWGPAPEVIDYYVVTRKIYMADGVETETLECNENSMKMIRQGDVMESYSVQSSRLGYLSTASNTITVAPWAGIFSVSSDCPFEVQTDRQGFMLAGGIDSIDVTVYDIQGRTVYSAASLAPGVRISLPSGRQETKAICQPVSSVSAEPCIAPPNFHRRPS